MAYENPQIEGEHVPAIILYGDVIRDMNEAHRQEVAVALEALLGVKAVAADVHVNYLGSPDSEDLDSEITEPAETIPPFTLLVDDTWNHEWGRNKYVDAARERTPGVIEDEVQAKRALGAVMGRAYKQGDDAELFTYHFGEPTRHGRRPLRGVTFENPQMIIDNPEQVRERVRQLGPKTTRALAQFVVAFTRVQNQER
jgi:hypothetical protein